MLEYLVTDFSTDFLWNSLLILAIEISYRRQNIIYHYFKRENSKVEVLSFNQNDIQSQKTHIISLFNKHTLVFITSESIYLCTVIQSTPVSPFALKSSSHQ